MKEHDHDELSREDRLIHRAVDGSAGVGDWAELELIARRDAGVWKRLALGMRGELSLRRAGVALEAHLPSLPAGRPAENKRAAILVGALGWAAALLISIFWVGASGFGSLGSPDGQNDTSLGQGAPPAGSFEAATLAASAAWGEYLGAGTARELEPVILSALPSLDGTAIEVTFLRRAIERTTIDEVHEIREDDAGQLSTQAVPAMQLVSNDI